MRYKTPEKRRKKTSLRQRAVAILDRAGFFFLIPLFLLGLLMSLFACTPRQPPPETVPAAHVLLPPAALYREKPLPDLPAAWTPRSNAALTASLYVWIGEANADRAALREWAEALRLETAAEWKK